MPIDEGKENPQRITDQSILMFNLKELSLLSKKTFDIPVENCLRYARFNNLLVLDLDRTSPSVLPNLLLGQPKDMSSMIRLTTLQASLLVPRIRIFKVVYNSKLKKEIEIELPFEDFANPLDFEKIFETSSGRGTGAGIKSFTWKSMAQNEANLSQFSAKLVVFAQNIEELTKIRNSKEDNGRTFTVSIMDLIYQKADLRGGFNEGSNVYDPKYFGIKVELGWYLDQNNHETFRSEAERYFEDADVTLEAISKQKQNFYFTLQSHQFSFNEDGSIEVTIDYIITAESEGTNVVQSNILRLDEETEKKIATTTEGLKQINKRIAALELNSVIENKPEFSGNKKEGGFFSGLIDDVKSIIGLDGTEEDIPTPIEELKSERERYEKALRDIPRGYRVERFKSIIHKLLKCGLMKALCVSQNDIETLISIRAKVVTSTDDIEFIKNKIDKLNLNTKELQSNSLDLNGIDAVANITEESVGFKGEQVPFLTEQTGKVCPDKDGRQINYFYLGDLLDVILDDIFISDRNVKTDFRTKTTRVILGPITYYDFGSIKNGGVIVRGEGLENKDGQVIRRFRGEQTVVNIADIPISLNDFTKWFVGEFAGRETISFLDFSRKLINDLVITSIASDAFTFAPSQQVRVDLLPFSVPKMEWNEGIFNRVIQERAPAYFRFDLSHGVSALKPFMDGGATFLPEKQNYLLFYGTNQPPFERRGDINEDLKANILHFFIGEERSLIKKIDFKRNDNPKLRAHLTQLANPDKQQDGTFIREVYDANIDMIGNFLFLPGQQVFIHPTYPGQKGRNERENLFKKLGLGGYYFILEVDNSIENSTFSTRISARWNAYGDGTVNIGDKKIAQDAVVHRPLNETTKAELVTE